MNEARCGNCGKTIYELVNAEGEVLEVNAAINVWVDDQVEGWLLIKGYQAHATTCSPPRNGKPGKKGGSNRGHDYPPMTDDTPMPFGKHKGTRMKDVPADYLLWWVDSECVGFDDLREYIKVNVQGLNEEAEKESKARDESSDDEDEPVAF